MSIKGKDLIPGTILILEKIPPVFNNKYYLKNDDWPNGGYFFEAEILIYIDFQCEINAYYPYYVFRPLTGEIVQISHHFLFCCCEKLI